MVFEPAIGSRKIAEKLWLAGMDRLPDGIGAV
jgi:hypothetical protein